MHKEPKHVINFLVSQMGASGSLDGQQRPVIIGRFAPMNFEGILQRYTNSNQREHTLCFSNAKQCGSERFVAPIKSGFVAQTSHQNAGI
ncbi:hypothetical protein MKX01_014440 [Papaver californicum]|nr:hypothetical protein MKX01_014440 [Papaver californicum]